MGDMHYDMCVIIISGQASCNARDRAMEYGAIGYLQKPFSAESLLELVRKQEPLENGS
jgi:FixJ family two-component response regulator